MSVLALIPQRLGRRAAIAVASLLAVFCFLVLLRQLIFPVASVTLGEPAFPYALALQSSFAPHGLLAEDELHVCAAVLLLSSLPILLCVRAARGAPVALSLARALVGFVVLAASYRLIALLAFVALILVSSRAASSRRRPVLAWLPLALVVATAVLPVDFSLQNLPGPPRFVPAISGLLSRSAFEHAAQGQFVIVGACIPFFNEPSWVWVW